MSLKSCWLPCLLVWVMATSCQKAPTVRIIAAKNSPQGTKTTLLWEVAKVDKLYLMDETKNKSIIPLKPDQQSYQFTIVEDYHYTLVAEKGNKKSETTLQGKALKNPPKITLFKGDSWYIMGQQQPCILRWKVENAQLVYLDKVAYDIKNQGEAVIAPDTATTYELVAINQFGDTTRAYHHIEVRKITGTAKFTEDILIESQPNAFNWNYQGASWVMLPDISADTLPDKGTINIVPKANTIKLNTRVIVKYPNEEPLQVNLLNEVRPVVIDMKINKLNVNYSEEIFIKWKVRGGKNIVLYIDGEKQAIGAEGSQKAVIYHNTKIVIICYDIAGRSHIEDWDIICQNRVFVKDAITYQQFLQNKENAKNKPHRLVMHIFQTDRSNYPKEVVLKVIVEDTLGNFIRGLAPPDLSMTDTRKFFLEIIETVDKHPYNIDKMSVKEVNTITSKGYDIAFCLDYSGSMAGYIKHVDRVMRKFINQKEANDRYSIIRFDHNLKKVSSMEIDRNVLARISWNGFDDLGGGTALYAGMDEALETFINTDKDRQKILIVVTDGRENSSFAHNETRLFRADDIIKKAREMGVTVYPIGLGNGANLKALELMGQMTGGNFYNIYEGNKIDSLYAELPRIFKNYYEIRYTPKIDASKTTSGTVDVTLTYNNQIKISNTKTIIQTHNNFMIDEDFQETVVLTGSNMSTKRMISPPQAVAFFEFDKHELKTTFMPALDNVLEYLQKNKDTKIEVYGHTDLVGTDEQNMELSKKRAEEVADYFKNKGIAVDRIKVVPKGKTQPVWKEEKEEWQAAENRRIEIAIFK